MPWRAPRRGAGTGAPPPGSRSRAPRRARRSGSKSPPRIRSTSPSRRSRAAARSAAPSSSIDRVVGRLEEHVHHADAVARRRRRARRPRAAPGSARRARPAAAARARRSCSRRPRHRAGGLGEQVDLAADHRRRRARARTGPRAASALRPSSARSARVEPGRDQPPAARAPPRVASSPSRRAGARQLVGVRPLPAAPGAPLERRVDRVAEREARDRRGTSGSTSSSPSRLGLLVVGARRPGRDAARGRRAPARRRSGSRSARRGRAPSRRGGRPGPASAARGDQRRRVARCPRAARARAAGRSAARARRPAPGSARRSGPRASALGQPARPTRSAARPGRVDDRRRRRPSRARRAPGSRRRSGESLGFAARRAGSRSDGLVDAAEDQPVLGARGGDVDQPAALLGLGALSASFRSASSQSPKDFAAANASRIPKRCVLRLARHRRRPDHQVAVTVPGGEPAAEVGDGDDRELQPLGGVHGHHPHAVVALGLDRGHALALVALGALRRRGEKAARSRPSLASYSRARRISLRTFAIRPTPPRRASSPRS